MQASIWIDCMIYNAVGLSVEYLFFYESILFMSLGFWLFWWRLYHFKYPVSIIKALLTFLLYFVLFLLFD